MQKKNANNNLVNYKPIIKDHFVRSNNQDMKIRKWKYTLRPRWRIFLVKGLIEIKL